MSSVEKLPKGDVPAEKGGFLGKVENCPVASSIKRVVPFKSYFNWRGGADLRWGVKKCGAKKGGHAKNPLEDGKTGEK